MVRPCLWRPPLQRLPKPNPPVGMPAISTRIAPTIATIAEPVIAARIRYTSAASKTASRIPIISIPSFRWVEDRLPGLAADENRRAERDHPHQHPEVRVGGPQAPGRGRRADRRGRVGAVDRQSVAAGPAGRRVGLAPA